MVITKKKLMVDSQKIKRESELTMENHQFHKGRRKRKKEAWEL